MDRQSCFHLKVVNQKLQKEQEELDQTLKKIFINNAAIRYFVRQRGREKFSSPDRREENGDHPGRLTNGLQ